MALWLCLRFEQLPLQALTHTTLQAVVVSAQQRVIACCDHAAEYGVKPSQRNATARKLLEGQRAQWLERDPRREQVALEQLLSWAYSYSPSVQTWHPNCLQIEISGSLLLFDGAENLITRALNELSRRGFTATPGLGETRRAAWLLSHATPPSATDTVTAQPDRLAPLPLQLLSEFERDVNRLERAGIRTLGDLQALPPRALGQRCSTELRHWLAQMNGSQREVVAHYTPPPHFRDVFWFGFEVRHRDELLPAMTALLRCLCDFLRQTQRTARQLEWQLLRTSSGSTEVLTVRSDSAGFEWQRWLELSSLRLERVTLERDIEGLALTSDSLEPSQPSSTDLFADRRQNEPQQALIDRLRNRMGLTAIARIGSRSEHLPELCNYTSAEIEPTSTGSPSAKQRPFWLLPQPQPIHSHQNQLFWNGKLTLLQGPERIEDSWWQQPTSRDYYIAQRENEEPVWIFQDRRSKHWYLQGLFD